MYVSFFPFCLPVCLSSSLSLPPLLSLSLSPSGCDKNFHKGCAFKLPNDCTRHWGDNPSSSTSSLQRNPKGSSSLPRSSSSNRLRDRKETWSGRPLWIDKALHNRPQVPHTFFVQSFKKPTACHHCKKVVSNLLHLTIIVHAL